MKGTNIWLLAHGITFIGLLFWQLDAVVILISIVTAICGLPSLLAFIIWFGIMSEWNVSAKLRTILSLVAIPTITAINAINVTYMFQLDNDGVLDNEAITLVAITSLSSLLATVLVLVPFTGNSKQHPIIDNI